MRVTPPSFKKRDETASALDYELARERAGSLGRSGRKLESTLAALSAFDRENATDAHDTRLTNDRNSLASAAGVALWSFVVQRESLGLRDSAAVMRAYAIPADVQVRMGAFPADPT